MNNFKKNLSDTFLRIQFHCGFLQKIIMFGIGTSWQFHQFFILFFYRTNMKCDRKRG